MLYWPGWAGMPPCCAPRPPNQGPTKRVAARGRAPAGGVESLHDRPRPTAGRIHAGAAAVPPPSAQAFSLFIIFLSCIFPKHMNSGIISFIKKPISPSKSHT